VGLLARCLSAAATYRTRSILGSPRESSGFIPGLGNIEATTKVDLSLERGFVRSRTLHRPSVVALGAAVLELDKGGTVRDGRGRASYGGAHRAVGLPTLVFEQCHGTISLCCSSRGDYQGNPDRGD